MDLRYVWAIASGLLLLLWLGWLLAARRGTDGGDEPQTPSPDEGPHDDAFAAALADARAARLDDAELLDARAPEPSASSVPTAGDAPAAFAAVDGARSPSPDGTPVARGGEPATTGAAPELVSEAAVDGSSGAPSATEPAALPPVSSGAWSDTSPYTAADARSETSSDAAPDAAPAARSEPASGTASDARTETSSDAPIETLATRVRTLERELAARERVLARLAQELDALRRRHAAVAADGSRSTDAAALGEREEQIDILSTQLEAVTAESSALRERLRTSEDRVAVLEALELQATDALGEMRRQLASRTESVRMLEDRVREHAAVERRLAERDADVVKWRAMAARFVELQRELAARDAARADPDAELAAGDAGLASRRDGPGDADGAHPSPDALERVGRERDAALERVRELERRLDERRARSPDTPAHSPHHRPFECRSADGPVPDGGAPDSGARDGGAPDSGAPSGRALNGGLPERRFELSEKREDLKLIKGIGPKMERLLNDLGVTSFAQLAAFTQHDIDRVAAAIDTFPNRIERDDWVGKARELERRKREIGA